MNIIYKKSCQSHRAENLLLFLSISSFTHMVEDGYPRLQSCVRNFDNEDHVNIFEDLSLSSFIDGSYLREWASRLDVPILSVDYSLAPEAPFPRALEEVFYAYCWALDNPELCGSTGENIVFVGDSAGANLMTTCIIRCIQLGIRKPLGVLNIYAAFCLNYMMAPSRFVGLMDIILPYSTHMRLFDAYIGVKKPKTAVVKNREIPKAPANEFDLPCSKDYLFSPYYAPDQILKEFPQTIILSTNLDSCLDECIEFSKKLRNADVNVQLHVLEGLNHGFLNFSQVKLRSQ